MNTCYDFGTRLRSGLIALLIAVSASAAGATAAPRMPWRATVVAPRPGLPAVAVELGYPGPYVPSINAPVVLRATAADVAFDGTIGFHFAVQERLTIDAPVVARVKLAPHQSWTFRTFANVRRRAGTPWDAAVQPREFVVEWRDAAMQLIASRSAGIPPWTHGRLQTLVVAPASVEGGYAAAAGELSPRGQWYAGFADVIVPLAAWLDLPAGVRAAIFGSGIDVIFIGFPHPGQQLDAVTRALLPVTFAAHPGSYQLVWPYGAASVAAPLSWTAKPTVGTIGSPRNPYIARSATAAWVADGNALARPLPSLLRTEAGFTTTWIDRPADSRRSAWVAAIGFLLAVLSWVLVVRNRAAAAIAVLVALIAGLTFMHDRIRAKAKTFQQVLHAPLAPGIALDLRQVWAYGPTPLAPVRADLLGITSDDGLNNNVEVRTDDTPPSMGLLDKDDAWDAAVRWVMHRQLDDAVAMDRPIVVPSAIDLHDMTLWTARPAASPSRYVVLGELQTLADGRMQSTFGLAPSEMQPQQSAVIHVGVVFAQVPLEVRWATGSLQLPVSAPAVARGPQGVIPPDALRSILSSGGVFDVIATPDRHVLQRSYRVSLAVQERKS